MARLSCDKVRDRLELHALGTLTADEADDVDRHLADCRDCHAAFEQALETVAAMAQAAEEIDPIEMPSDAKSRVWERIQPRDVQSTHDPDTASTPSWLDRLQWLLGGVRWRAALAGLNVALLIALGVLIFQHQATVNQMDQRLGELQTGFEILLSRSDENASSTFMSATSEGESGSWGTVISHPESELALVLVGDISRPPADAEYHVWFQRGDALVNAGAVRFGADKLTENKGWLISRKPEDVGRVLVTLEPAGDTPEERPAGPTVLAADYN